MSPDNRSTSDCNTPSLEAHSNDAAVKNFEIVISIVLRVGVITSLCIVTLGTILTFIHHNTYLHPTPSFEGTLGKIASFPHTLSSVWAGLRNFHGEAIIAAGLLILILTPVARVAVSIIVFLYQKDMKFVFITTLVLALLLASFFLGKVGG